MRKTLIILLVTFQLIVGCAPLSNTIAPTNTSPLDYRHLSCREIDRELTLTNQILFAESGKQDDRAAWDVAFAVVSVGIWIPFAAIRGNSKEYIAELKGKVIALEYAFSEKCYRN